MIAGLLAGAALASVDPAIENDLRCIGVFAIAASQHEKMAENEQSGVTGAMMFYIGRIEGRDPEFRLEDSLVELLSSPSYFETLAEDARRCSDEMVAKGQQLVDLGKALEQASKDSAAEGQ
jgi:hypothetical protein